MRTTGKFDSNGVEIFEGDKVVQAWGWFKWKGEMKTNFRVSTINVKPAHRMNNGEMHDDGGGIIFNVGSAYNFWEGKSVTKLTPEQLERFKAIPEDELFFFDGETPVLLTDQHFMGLNDEEWEIEKQRRRKELDKIFFPEL